MPSFGTLLECLGLSHGSASNPKQQAMTAAGCEKAVWHPGLLASVWHSLDQYRHLQTGPVNRKLILSLALTLLSLSLSLCLLPTCQNASNKIKFRGDRCWELVETRFQREEAKDSSPRVHAASSASLEVFSSSP